MPAESVVLQLRGEPELIRSVKAQAAREKISTNRMVINAIKLYLAQEKNREWREGFEAIGRDPEANSADYLLPAAREVVFGE